MEASQTDGLGMEADESAEAAAMLIPCEEEPRALAEVLHPVARPALVTAM